MQILSKPWFLAVLALVLMLGTQVVALKLYWDEVFPAGPKTVVIKREDPKGFTWGFSSNEIVQLELELKTRLANLALREQELSDYESRLAADREEIEDIKNQVARMREKFVESVVKLEADEQKNLKTLAKTYSAIAPEAAVSIFRELDDSTVVKILFFMKSDTVGSILEEMATAEGGVAEQVKRAARLSDMLRLFTDNTQNQLQPNI